MCVSEAAWRLQLFTDTNFAQQIGCICVAEHISAVSDTQDDWLYLSEESESEDEKEAGSPSICSAASNRAQKPTSKRSKSEPEKSSESGSHSNKSGGWYR
jgi:hypothetical protein